MMDRRRVLTAVVATFSAVAGGAVAWPFIRSWFPAGVADPSLDVPLHDLKPGRPKVVRWRGRNVLVVRRAGEARRQVLMASESRLDPASARSLQPDFATGPMRSRKDGVFVAYANCPHLGCEVEVRFDAAGRDLAGFSCPCHRSEFDAAGRVAADAAAKRNLDVPYYEYLPDDVIRLARAP